MREVQAAGGAALSARKPLIGPVQLLALGVGLLGLGLDQIAKAAALKYLEPGRSIDVIGPLLKLTLIRNPGAAFGMGGNFTIGFSVFAILALIGCLIFAMPRIKRATHAVALGLLLAGISGNLWDRIFREPRNLHGHVIDFLHVPFFAIFNVADICITVAAIWIVWLSFTGEKRDAEEAGSAPEAVEDEPGEAEDAPSEAGDKSE